MERPRNGVVGAVLICGEIFALPLRDGLGRGDIDMSAEFSLSFSWLELMLRFCARRARADALREVLALGYAYLASTRTDIGGVEREVTLRCLRGAAVEASFGASAATTAPLDGRVEGTRGPLGPDNEAMVLLLVRVG